MFFGTVGRFFRFPLDGKFLNIALCIVKQYYNPPSLLTYIVYVGFSSFFFL